MQIFTINFKVTRKVFYLLIALSAFLQPCSAESYFIEQFQVKPEIKTEIADKIARLYSNDINLPLHQQKTQLLKLQKQLDSISDKHSSKAIFWFIQGLQYQNMAAYYSQLNKKEQLKKLINNKNIAYKKAIEADTNENLSASIYSTMKNGLPQELKIIATQQELKLGGNGDSDSQYWYLHWSNIDQLKNAGRDEEAEQAFKNMQQEMKFRKVDMSIYKSMSNTIEKSTLKHTRSANKKTPAKTKEKKQTDTKIDLKYILLYFISAISFLLLAGVTIYEVRKNKKKQ